MQLKDLFYGLLFVITGMIVLSCSDDEHPAVPEPEVFTEVTEVTENQVPEDSVLEDPVPEDSVPEDPVDPSSTEPKTIAEMIVGVWEMIDQFPSKTYDLEYTFSPDGTFISVQNDYKTTGVYAVREEDERAYEKNMDSAYMLTADNQFLPYSHYVHIDDYQRGTLDFGIIIIDDTLYLSMVHRYSAISLKYIFQRKESHN